MISGPSSSTNQRRQVRRPLRPVDPHNLPDEPHDHSRRGPVQLEMLTADLQLFDKSKSAASFDFYEKLDDFKVLSVGAGAGSRETPEELGSSIDDYPEQLQDTMRRLGYKKLVSMQRTVMPIVQQGRDALICAQTGTGKTFSYAYPILEKAREKLIAIVVVPTGYLVRQTEAYFNRIKGLSAIGIYGKIFGQYDLLERRLKTKNLNVVVCTTGKLMMALKRNCIPTCDIQYLILDEADKLVERDFEELRDIGKQLGTLDMITGKSMPGKCNIWISATFAIDAQRKANMFLSKDFVYANFGGEAPGIPSPHVEQYVELFSNELQKRERLLEILSENKITRDHKIMIFVNTKKTCLALEKDLRTDLEVKIDIRKLAYCSSCMDEREKLEIDTKWRKGQISCLVTTDLLSRGHDSKDVQLVIQFDLPHVRYEADADIYIHRLGRTGRAGNLGKCISFYNPNRDARMLRYLQEWVNDEQRLPMVLRQNFDPTNEAFAKDPCAVKKYDYVPPQEYNSDDDWGKDDS